MLKCIRRKKNRKAHPRFIRCTVDGEAMWGTNRHSLKESSSCFFVSSLPLRWYISLNFSLVFELQFCLFVQLLLCWISPLYLLAFFLLSLLLLLLPSVKLLGLVPDLSHSERDSAPQEIREFGFSLIADVSSESLSLFAYSKEEYQLWIRGVRALLQRLYSEEDLFEESHTENIVWLNRQRFLISFLFSPLWICSPFHCLVKFVSISLLVFISYTFLYGFWPWNRLLYRCEHKMESNEIYKLLSLMKILQFFLSTRMDLRKMSREDLHPTLLEICDYPALLQQI